MNKPITTRMASAILVLGIVSGSLSVTAGTAFASSRKHKVGSTCTKSELNERVKAGKTILTCQEITLYEWQK
jgi:hypothetical protein